MEKPSEETMMVVVSTLIIFSILIIVIVVLMGWGPENVFGVVQGFFTLISVWLLAGLKNILHG
ncbi:MAG TPA: hypothetical protein VI933_03455 [archaeon]|nr:hypothetical protein [archaeon]